MTHILTFTNISVYDFVSYWMSTLRQPEQMKHRVINSFLSRLNVKAKWSGRTYKIDSIDFNQTPFNTKANTKDNTKANTITIAKYFQDKYKIKLGQFPLIKSKDIYLPSEQCMIASWQLPPQKYLSQFDIIAITRQDPRDRYKRILNLADSELSKFVQDLGLEMGKNMTEVEAKVLPFPTIKTGPQSAAIRNYAWQFTRPDSWKLNSSEVGFVIYDVHKPALSKIAGFLDQCAMKFFGSTILFTKKRFEEVRRGDDIAGQIIKAVHKLSFIFR
jgi:hypothetical protein